MEIRINDLSLPEKIIFNYEELKEGISAKVEHYKNLVYTDDQIKEAKEDRANLNKLKKALNDERIRLEKEYMIPFNTFKAQLNEIIKIIDEPVTMIDSQVKEYQENKKEEKRKEIVAYFDSVKEKLPDEIGLEGIFNTKWLNESVSMKSVKKEIDDIVCKIQVDISTINDLGELSFYALEKYFKSHNLNDSILFAKEQIELEKKKAEFENKNEEMDPVEPLEEPEIVSEIEEIPFYEPEDNFIPDFREPERAWMALRVNVSEEEKKLLIEFLREHNFDFKEI